MSRSSSNAVANAANGQSRRRPSPAQLRALQKTFDHKTHPTKKERSDLATEIGMDLKNVNTWFQNKRTAAKKRALSWKNPASDIEPHVRSLNLPKTTSIPRAPQQTASLDFIAKLSERPSRPPATPRRRSDLGTQTQIWERMLSSPPTGPISPSVDASRFKALPTRSKTWKSMEWACANARASGNRKSDKENVPETLPRPALKKQQGEGEACEDTDTEIDEALTPDSSADWFPTFVRSGTQKTIGEEELASEDMEVAMVLLDFNKRCKEGIVEKIEA